ncbi:MAG: pentapeptide repeat-containing protein [Planctomycetota bacterium]
MVAPADAPALLARLLTGDLPLSTWNAFVVEHGATIDLTGVNLASQMLSGISFTRCRMSGANFQRSCLQNADLSYTELSGANFAGADLRGALLCHARCQRADFQEAEMRGADLSWAKLASSNLTGVDLNLVKLWKTDLRGAQHGQLEASAGTDFMGVTNAIGQAIQTRMVPFPRMLRVVGAMAGVPHHWRGTEASAPMVSLPDPEEDPAAFLEAKIQEFGFKKMPRCSEDGSLLYVEVARP